MKLGNDNEFPHWRWIARAHYPDGLRTVAGTPGRPWNEVEWNRLPDWLRRELREIHTEKPEQLNLWN